MRRALAIIGVVLLLAVAWFIRGRGEASRQQLADEKAKATLYCAQELGKVCDTLKERDRNLTVVTEEAGRTLETVTAADFNPEATRVDGWLAPQPFIDLANESRNRSSLEPLFGTSSRVLARSPVVMVGTSERLQKLAGACGGQVTWRCVGENAGRRWSELGGQETWGDLRPVIADPARSATGLFSLGEAATSFFGSSNFASNDFATGDFDGWLQRFASTSKGVTNSPKPLEERISKGRSALDLTAAFESQAGPAVTSSARANDPLTILYPSPLATADVVLAPISGSEPGGRLKDLLESDDAATALAQSGWRVDGRPTAAGINPNQPLPSGSGLPKAGVLQSLAERWKEAG